MGKPSRCTKNYKEKKVNKHTSGKVFFFYVFVQVLFRYTPVPDNVMAAALSAGDMTSLYDPMADGSNILFIYFIFF
jgi:hypothetical protein